jgi:hypothetical protein
MKLHRHISVILVFAMILTLTACGKSSGASSTSSSDYYGEGQVQGGIKSDGEIAALQEEERAGTTDAQQSASEDEIENNQQSGDSDATPATSEIDAQNYWEGDDYFDIVRCAEDNNCVAVWYCDSQGNAIQNNNSTAIGHYFFFSDWMVSVTGSTIELIYTRAKDENGHNLNKPEYLIVVPNSTDLIPVSRENSAVASREAIDAFIVILNAINSKPGDQDPLNGTGLNYVEL